MNNYNSQICPNCITWASKYAKLKFEHKKLIKKYLALEEKIKNDTK